MARGQRTAEVFQQGFVNTYDPVHMSHARLFALYKYALCSDAHDTSDD